MSATVSKDELISSLSTFSGIADLTSDVFIVFDQQINILYINQAVFALIGYTPAEVMADPFGSVFREQEEIIRFTLDHAIAQKVGYVRDIHSKHIHKQTGNIVWIQFTATLIYKDGEFQYGFACGKDHTQAVNKEAEIARLNARLERTEEAAGFGSWETDFNTGEFFLSKGFRAMFCLGLDEKPENLDGLLRLIYPEDRDHFHKSLTALSARENLDSEIEFRIINSPSGAIKVIRSRTSPVYDQGKVTGVKGICQDITTHHTNLQALEAANANLLENQLLAEMGNWEFDLRTDRYEWSEGTRAIYELAAGSEPLNSVELMKLIHPEDVNTVASADQVSQMKFDSNIQVENRIVTSTGKTKSLRHIMKPVYEQGMLVKLRGITLDVTRQKEYEHEIIRSRERFKILYDSMHQGVIFQDKTGNVYDANQTAKNLFGLTSNKSNSVFVTPKFVTRTREVMPLNEYPHSKVFQSGQAIVGQVMHVINEKNNVERIIRVDAFPLRHENDENIYGVFSLFEDITTLTKSLELLKISNQKFSDAFYSSGIGMAIVDLQSNFLEINEMFCKILGYSTSELWKISFKDLLHEEDRAYHQYKTEQLWTGKIQTYQHERRYYHKSGSLVWAILTSSVVRNKTGEALYIVSQLQDVTQLKEEQILRQESEAKYKALIESSTMGISIIKDLKVVYANNVLKKMFGYKASTQGTEVNVAEYATEETKKVIATRIRKLAEGKPVSEAFVGEFYIKSRIRSLEVHVKNLKLSGKPFRMVMVRDITDTLTAQKKLSETERVFRVAQNFAKIGTWKWNIASDEIFWSDVTYKIFGLKKRPFMTFPQVLKSVDERDRAWVNERMEKHLNARTSFTLEYRINTGKKVKWIMSSGKIVCDTAGKLVEVYGVVRDITATKHEEEKIQRILKKLKIQNEIIDSANRRLTESQRKLAESNKQLKLKDQALNEMAIVVTSDANGLIKDVNDRFIELYGYKRSEVVDKSYGIRHDSIYNSGFHDRKFFDTIWATLKKGGVWRGEICNRAKSGKLFWLLKTVVPLMNEKGKLDRLFSFSEDITLLKAREREIIEAKELAENASRVKEEFLSIMSHEIRTPLNSVIGLGNLLLKKSPREDQVEIMQSLKNSGDNLLHLVNDILDYNKIQVQKVELEELEFNTHIWLEQVNASFKTMAAEKGLEFQVKVDAELPLCVLGDKTRATQILNNLIGNALKFTRRGFVHVLVSIFSTNEDDVTVSFEIKDSGIGISNEKLESLYIPFQQGEKDINRRFGGTGLGLSIVKGLLELMNGTLEVASTPGRGSSFTIRLPFRKASRSVVGSANNNQEKASTAIDLRGTRVLYVEDVESNRFLIHNVLQNAGLVCTTVPDGRTALTVSARTKFDVILMDIQMPVMNGYQVIHAIRKQPKGKNLETPVIAFTAKSPSVELKDRIVQQGFDDLIHKPFQTEVLWEKITRVLQLEDKEKELVSFRFYEQAFNFDFRKLGKIRAMIFKEFSQFEVKFLQACKKKDEKAIRREIHTLRPILKNLECTELQSLLDQYTLDDWKAVDKLNGKLKKLVVEICNHVKRYKPVKPPVMNKLLRKKLNVLIHLAKIDGKFDDREKKFLHKLLEENGYRPEQLEDHKTHIIPDDMTSLKGREELLYWVIKLMHADGVIHPSEVSYCKKVAQQLGFNPEIIDNYTHTALPSFSEFVDEMV
jgi:PAS domain S-box-containing protein